ncbi:hypothetical protein ABIA99_007754 [Bradyrhizobium sp. LB12.1]|uniref:cellulase family glycosylhydrolase n=1 Tax=Bradyrhizobium sp. LB12.1 TaxID=3156327 RepID=UPI0033972ABE
MVTRRQALRSLTLGLSLSLASSGRLAQANGQFFSIPIKGINVNPPFDSWGAAKDGLTANRIAALKFAGYNTLRLWIDLESLLRPSPDLATAVAANIAFVRNAILNGFKAVVTFATTPELRLSVMNPVGDYYLYLAACVALGAELSSAFGESVAFEVMNEPPTKLDVATAGYPDYATAFCPAVFKAVRAAAPQLWLIFESSDLGYAPFLADFNPDGFDARTAYAAHGYDPGEFTHQGLARLWKHIDRLPWPVTDYPGGIIQAKADMVEKVNADSTLTFGQKSSLITANTSRLDSLFGWNGQTTYFGGLNNALEKWRRRHGIDSNRIIFTEFGVVSSDNYDDTPGADLTARVAYEKARRQDFESRRYGWIVYQALGDFQHFEGTPSNQGERLIVELTEALGLRCPNPAPVNDLTYSGVTTSTVTLTFAAVTDAARYEYRLNGGKPKALGQDRVITGLFPATTYDIEIRGVNNSSNGSWSNVITIRA